MKVVDNLLKEINANVNVLIHFMIKQIIEKHDGDLVLLDPRNFFIYKKGTIKINRIYVCRRKDGTLDLVFCDEEENIFHSTEFFIQDLVDLTEIIFEKQTKM